MRARQLPEIRYAYYWSKDEQEAFRKRGEARQENADRRHLKPRVRGDVTTHTAGIVGETTCLRMFREAGVQVLFVPDDLDHTNQPDFVVRIRGVVVRPGSRALMRPEPGDTMFYPWRPGKGRDAVIWCGTRGTEWSCVLGWTPYSAIEKIPERAWVKYDEEAGGEVATDDFYRPVPAELLRHIDELVPPRRELARPSRPREESWDSEAFREFALKGGRP